MMNKLRKLLQGLESLAVLGMNERNARLVYPHNQPAFMHLANDKIETKTVLEARGLPHPETFAILDRLDAVQHQWSRLQVHEQMAIKPAKGSGGGGILVLGRNEAGQWRQGSRPIEHGEVLKSIGNILMGVYSKSEFDRAIVEYCIQPHPFFHAIFPGGVPDFRVILLHGEPLLAMLRMPTAASKGKANLHQGGIGIGIDLPNGVLREGYRDRTYWQTHPDSGFPFSGTSIPYWRDILALAKATAAAFPLSYLGVDIVLDQKEGPLVLEINTRPGLAIQLANRTGLPLQPEISH